MAKRSNVEKEVSVSSTSGVTPSRRTPARARSKRAAAPAEPPAPAIQSPAANVSDTAEIAAKQNPLRVAAPSHQEIAQLAYSYWEQRGYTGGSSEEDWLRAERELRSSGITA